MGKIHAVYIIIIIILLGIIGVGYMHYNSKNASLYADDRLAARQGMMQQQSSISGGRIKGGMSGMAPVTPPFESDQQKAQLTAGTDTSSTDKTFNITGGNFYFVPKQITVNKGDKVTFVFTNSGGMHDLVIKDLNVKTPVVQGGTTSTVTFTADKTGSFVYYCDVNGHKQKGMWGTLVVK